MRTWRTYRQKNCKENMIRREIILKLKEPGQNEKWHSIVLFVCVNGNKVENRVYRMEKVMLA